jgi:predicted transcriptional regulator
MTAAVVLSRLFEMSGLTAEAFIQKSGISTSQFYKILSFTKSGGANFDCMQSTIRAWVATSATEQVDLQGEWFSLVLNLCLDQATINKLMPAQDLSAKKESWLAPILDSFFPDAFKLIKRK